MVKEKPEFVEKLKQKGVKYTRVLPENDDPSSPIGNETFLSASFIDKNRLGL